MLGLAFGLFHKLQSPPRRDWLLEAGWNLGLALLVGLLALLVLTVVSSGYIWTAPAIVLGILGGSVTVGLGVTLAFRQRESLCEPTDLQPAVAASAPPAPSPSGTDAMVKRATAASQAAVAATSPAGSLVQSRADTGASPAPPATPDAADPGASAPPEATRQRFSFGAFVAACFVMVLLAWIAADLAAPHRGPQSEHVTTLGTHPFVQDQRPVNRALAMSIALTALIIAKVAWRPGWRSFAAGILFSGLLLALLALGLHI